mgnify:FL=1
MATYVPNTKEEQRQMLNSIGLNAVDELYSSIPNEVKLKAPLNIPKGMSEMDLSKSIRDI